MPQLVDALLARPPFRALVVPSKKIETLIEMNDTGFFCAQLQSQSVGYRADRFQITADECRTKPEVAPNKLERPRTPLESSIRPHSTFTATGQPCQRNSRPQALSLRMVFFLGTFARWHAASRAGSRIGPDRRR